MVAVVCPAGTCLSILSTGTNRFVHWRTCCRVIDPLTNQTALLCTLSQERFPTKSTLSMMSRWFVVLSRLTLRVYGVEAGKLRMVQSPSRCRFDGTVLTLPSITPPYVPVHVSACAGRAPNSKRASPSSRIAIQPRRALFVTVQPVLNLAPLAGRSHRQETEAARSSDQDSGGPAVVGLTAR